MSCKLAYLDPNYATMKQLIVLKEHFFIIKVFPRDFPGLMKPRIKKVCRF